MIKTVRAVPKDIAAVRKCLSITIPFLKRAQTNKSFPPHTLLPQADFCQMIWTSLWFRSLREPLLKVLAKAGLM